MTTFDKIIHGITETIKMNDRIISLADKIKELASDIKEMDRRVIRIEAFVELATATKKVSPHLEKIPKR